MIGQSRSLGRLFVLGLAGVLLFQPAHASEPTPATTAGLSGDHWQVSVHAKAAETYSLTVDGKRVAQTTTHVYDLDKLGRGLHTVDIGAVPPQKLLIRESGARSAPLSTARTQVFAVSVEAPDPRKPAATIKVKQGDVVQLNISATAPVEVHLHGYDIEGRVGPATPLMMAFDANLAGRFPIETHGKRHGALAFIEVYPR